MPQVMSWKLRSSRSRSSPPRMRQTNSLTLSVWPSNVLMTRSPPGWPSAHRSRCVSSDWGSERRPEPKGKLRARKTGALAWITRLGVKLTAAESPLLLSGDQWTGRPGSTEGVGGWT